MKRIVRRIIQRAFAVEVSRRKRVFGVLDTDEPFPGTEEAVAAMTLDEKICMLGGFGSFAIHAVPRLGIPAVWMSDATCGLRLFGGGTAFPCPLAMAATWNRELIRKTAAAIGTECREKGVRILLGPGVNICRIPTGGRNFEYFGEDPFLAGQLAASYILGTRSVGVESVVKHFACNNSDYDRHRENAVVDRRTLQEIYLPSFYTAVKEGGVRFVMTSYNQVNGTYAGENEELLRDILRNRWGFTGMVMSDWIATYSTSKAIKAGLDLEMPGAKRFSRRRVLRALSAGEITEEDINERIRHILDACSMSGFYHGGEKNFPAGNSPETAIRVAEEGIVLLKNEGMLPLDPKRVRRIAVLGSQARGTETGGGGSSRVQPRGGADILTGLRTEAGPETEVLYIPDRKGRIGASGRRVLASADTAVVCVGFDHFHESEGFDRTWEIQENGASLIKEAAALHGSVVVVLTGGGPMETASWSGAVSGIIHSFYLGEQTGEALARVLFGRVNPSGRLPMTIPRSFEDVEAAGYYRKRPLGISLLRFLGPQGMRGIRRIRDITYGEELRVGYRGFPSGGPAPLYPFGFGLSYTTFSFEDPCLSRTECSGEELTRGEVIRLEVTLRNTGTMAGSEVLQVYVRDLESGLPRPEAELKGFEKVFLGPGESRRVSVELDASSFSYFDPVAGTWVIEPGLFAVRVSRSAADYEAELTVKVK